MNSWKLQTLLVPDRATRHDQMGLVLERRRIEEMVIFLDSNLWIRPRPLHPK
jgi:hypothetical protein